MSNFIYNIFPEEIFALLYQNKKAGCSLEAIKVVEDKLQVKLPEKLAQYYLNYGNLEINHCYHHLSEIEELYFSDEALEEEYEDCGYEEKYHQSLAAMKAEIGNYLVFWHENQGVFAVGLSCKDLDNPNPKVYMTTNDDFVTWEWAFNSLDSLFLYMLIENVYDSAELSYTEYKGGPMAAIIKEKELDSSKLVPDYSNTLVPCWDKTGGSLYTFVMDKGKLEKLYIITRN